MSRRRKRSDGRSGRVLRFVQQLPTRPARLDPLQQGDRPDPAFEGLWRDGIKRRTIVVLSLLACWAVIVEARLFDLQVIRHKILLDYAEEEQHRVFHPLGIRGDITDRNGNVLAVSVPAAAVISTPRDIKDKPKAVADVCRALGDCTAAERAKLLASFSTNGPYALVRHAAAVTPLQAENIKKAQIPGVGLTSDTLRYYPKGRLAANVVGYVGQENNGLGGIEYAYDEAIEGQRGSVRVLHDARGHGMDTDVEEAATSGATVELTLDDRLQYIAERELAAGVAEHHAEAGMAVIMNPNTGEILALANVPTFDPNAYGRVAADILRNRALQDAYEPGSTMKIVTISAALEEGVVTTTDTFDTDPGYLQIGSRRIHDAEGKNNGILSVVDVVVHSSNVGAGKIGLKLGAERLERYVLRYGFGQKLLPGLPGQSAGRVYTVSELKDSALASMAIGYQISVTPVQMAMAASVVANGGTLFEPHLVRAIVRDGVRQVIAPKPLRQVITPGVAATMTTILEQVVARGTGTKAAIDGFTVAGKTGTAAKLVNGTYSTTAYNASFVGFVPSRNPALTIIVVVDTPHSGGTHGGEVAAPIFSRIADAALRDLRVAPTNPLRTSIVVAADTKPAHPAPLSAAPPMVLLAPDAAGARMPDVRGLTPREAIRALDAAGLTVRMAGSGIVIGQAPAAGEAVGAGDITTIQLGRPDPAVRDSRATAGGAVR